MKKLAVLALAGLVTACGTYSGGTSQDITIKSNVDTASCSITQNGVQVVPPTAPGTYNIERRAGNLFVTCEAPGHITETVALMTGKHPQSVTGVMLTGALINVGTDAFTGGIHEYQNEAFVYLRKASN